MPYGLLVNGSLAELGDLQYLLSPQVLAATPPLSPSYATVIISTLSTATQTFTCALPPRLASPLSLAPQDLMALDLVPELIDAGVSCLKIEGRVKGPEYVALATRAYREAVDRAWAARTSAPAKGDAAAASTEGALVGADADANADADADDATEADDANANLSVDAAEAARRALAARGIVPPENDDGDDGDATAAQQRGRLAPDRRAELGRQLAQTFARAQDAEHDGLTAWSKRPSWRCHGWPFGLVRLHLKA